MSSSGLRHCDVLPDRERTRPNILVRWPRVIGSQRWLDPFATLMTNVGHALARARRVDALARGTWLGHPVHPALTDLPIGFWTSAMVIDVVGGPASRATARHLIACGNVTAVPTIIAGLADARDRAPADRRVASVHAALNGAGVLGYVASWYARGARRHRLGVATSFVAATLLTVAGHLGGHLVFTAQAEAPGSTAAEAADEPEG
jgi:uncharacterized membrane protein